MTIIAAVDFSSVSLRVARAAAAWAHRFGDDLELVHVVTPPPAMPHEIAANLGYLTDALTKVAERDLGRLQEELAHSESAAGVKVSARVIHGKTHADLVGYAEKIQARMMVMGAHERSDAVRLLLGSVSERTLRHATRPVLLIPASPVVDVTRLERMRVVAALDAGKAGHAARAWVADLRAKAALDVVFVHVFDAKAEHQRLGIGDPHDDMGDDPEVLSVLRREMEPLTRIAGEGDTHLVLRATWGHWPDSLAFEAETERANLIVTGLVKRRFHTTSVVDGTLRQATVPVLCIPVSSEQTDDAKGEIRPMRRVLAATDLSPLGNHAAVTAFQLLRESGGIVDLCHFVESAETVEAEGRRLTREMAALVPREAEKRNIRPRFHVVTGESARTAILQASERLGVDAIVMGSHGRGGVSRAVMGSVADGVMRGTDKPVLVVGPRRET